ncbi:MAG: hypothetical protein IAI48_16275 [Candidatus Eremiobacteraeota bacterium]|nr:hypothetical protein [Candidatus Eremiobacteraeota bacterium]
MLDSGEHASHLCHNPTCINHHHLVVEPKAKNEQRKECKLKLRGRITIAGKMYNLVGGGECECSPPCILRDVLFTMRRTSFKIDQ